MEKIVEKLKDVILVENDKLRQEFKETISQENDKLRQENQKLREEMNQKFDDIHKEMNDMKKEILDRQFIFENDYGSKIDAIYEYVQFHQEKNLQRFDRITNIEQRVDEIEVHNFDHEKRISTLERRKV